MPPIEYAFKCRNCGTLEPPGTAGELDRPAKCHVCGKGAHFDPESGVRTLDPDNWIILADLDADGTAEVVALHGLDPTMHVIVAHTPATPVPLGREPQAISVEATDGVGTEDVS